MLDGLPLSIHLVDVDASNSLVIGVIRQQIDEIHVSEHVVADGDDPVDDNASARMRRFNTGEVFSERQGTVSNQRIVLDVTWDEKFGSTFFRLILIYHHLIKRENVVDIADRVLIPWINQCVKRGRKGHFI